MISLGQHENRPVKTVRVGEKAGSIAQGVALTLSGKCESLCSASGSGKVLATPSSVPSMQAKSLSTLIRRVAWLSVSRSPRYQSGQSLPIESFRNWNLHDESARRYGCSK